MKYIPPKKEGLYSQSYRLGLTSLTYGHLFARSIKIKIRSFFGFVLT